MHLAENGHLTVPQGSPLLLRDLIHERLGIFFDPGRLDTMVEKVEEPARKRNCRSLLDYYYLLKYEEDGQNEWKALMDALSVQETYFWREFSQIDSLVNSIVPQWFKRTDLPLRIWSAACASGEEPYTISMALREAGWGNHPIEIYASDASQAALVKARYGLYRERSFRSLPPALREKYFSVEGLQWRLCPEIRATVRFQHANLVARNEIRHLAAAPVIFCRNVFIYFSADAIRRTVESFADFMPTQAWLFIGASESLLKITERFDLRELNNGFVYTRTADGRTLAE